MTDKQFSDLTDTILGVVLIIAFAAVVITAMMIFNP